MDFVKAASAADVPAGGMRSVKIGSEDVLIANIGGTYYAVSGLCTHRHGALVDGKLEGSTIVCPKHGATFDVITGKTTAGPKMLGFRGKTADLRVFEVKVVGPDILVKI